MLTKKSIVLCLVLVMIVVFSPLAVIAVHYDAGAAITPPSIKQADYDKQKNCTTDLSMHPTSRQYLTHFNCGHVSLTQEQNGTTTTTNRQFTLIVKENQKIAISNHGLMFDGWTFNGTIPGPTMRVTEGDHVNITVVNDAKNKLPHSLHLHSIHSAANDGVMLGKYPGGAIAPGKSFTYSFIASPFGVYPYHCHMDPLADHINRGLYGMLIIDPKTPRPHHNELVMLMNGYDLNLDQEGAEGVPTNAEAQSMQHPDKGKEAKDAAPDSERDNEVYSVNGRAFDYIDNPIAIKANLTYRIYLVNILEFDRVNSIHLHGTMFNYTIAGTKMTPDFLTDIVTLGQGDRGIIEFSYRYPGQYMFHAHQTEFTDKGWMGSFKVA